MRLVWAVEHAFIDDVAVMSQEVAPSPTTVALSAQSAPTRRSLTSDQSDDAMALEVRTDQFVTA